MIDKTKSYRTRDGREVRIYATDGVKPFSVHGAILFQNGWVDAHWTDTGSYQSEGRDLDLIEVKPRITGTLWVNVYHNNGVLAGGGWHSKESADSNAAPERIACIPIEIDVEDKS